jgi:hypothetical protein
MREMAACQQKSSYNKENITTFKMVKLNGINRREKNM